MREEFEAWAAIKFAVDAELLAASRTEEDMDDGFPYRVLNKHGEGSDLVNTLVGTAWAGWQASRAVLVIELPQQSGANLSWNQAIRYCHQSIEAAGVKVKP
jgi:hypothetical protein